MAIVKKLAEADPGNAAKQRDWLIGLSYIGDAYAAMNRHSDALPIYQEGLNLARTAVKEKPEATELKRDIGIWLSLVMNAHLQLSDPAAAIAPSLEAVELNRTLMKIDANDVRAKTDYVETLCDAGSALSRVNDSRRPISSSRMRCQFWYRS